MNNFGAWGINTAKYITSLRKHVFRQSHAAFHFLLDYVPLWELSYGRNGLIQYQSFLPKETALQTWTEMLATAKKRGLPSYLGVTKRHRPDNFLLTHAVDGFSLAMDFKVTDRNRAKLSEMLQEFDQMVLDAGGRFYFAKNSETSPETRKGLPGRRDGGEIQEIEETHRPGRVAGKRFVSPNIWMISVGAGFNPSPTILLYEIYC